MQRGGKQSVAIIGAGIAGLTAALELANAGCNVTVLERANQAGGKLRETAVGALHIDAGPTVFTMRWVFEELFEALGERLDNHLTLKPLDILARHAWNDETRLDLHADLQRSAEAIGDFAGAPEAKAFLAFSERAAKIYAALEHTFIRASRPSLPGLIARSAASGIGGIGELLRISPFTTLGRELGRHFRDARLQQLFGRYATYCGSSPFAAPATLMLVAHVEQQGVWTIDGGMYRLAAVLETLARAHGVVFRYGCDVDDIEVANGEVSGVAFRTEGRREKIAVDAVICNGDAGAVSSGILGRAASGAITPVPAEARSLSAVTWTLTAKTSGFPLLRHNVFFSRDYRREFEDIFGRKRLPYEPTVYLCAQDRDQTGVAAGDTERLLVLINAPATGDDPQSNMTFGNEELQQCEETVFQLMSRCGLTMRQLSTPPTITTPVDWNRLFPATGGALYGRASHGWLASFQRPGSRTRLPGLYLAGGSIHPGPGIAMAALSGRLAVQALLTDSRSIKSWHPMAMSGGMSTR